MKGIMTQQVSFAMFLGAIALGPIPAGAQEQERVLTNPPAVAADIPPSRACTKSSPCQNLTGQITRIEESYWVRTPEGGETHLRVTPETRVDALLKRGDSIAAQVTSTGDAETIVKLDSIPKPPQVSVPLTKTDDIRQGGPSVER
jgi:hypothetical protein